MRDQPGVPLWPDPSTRSPMWFLYFALFMLAVALVLSLLHRRRKMREALEKDWQAAKRVAERRSLNEQEWAAFTSLVQRWAPKDPRSAATRRLLFEELLDAEADSRADESLAVLEKHGKLLGSVRYQLGFASVPLDEPLRSTRELDRGQPVVVFAGQGRPGILRDTNALFFLVETSGEPPLLERGEQAAFRASRNGDARYEFTALFLGMDSETHQMAFLHSTRLQRMQARANERISFQRYSLVDILSPDRNAAEELRVLLGAPAWGQMEAEFIDISAVGVAMKAELSLPSSVLVRFELELDSGEPLRLAAQVVDSSPTEEGLHIVRVQYVQLGPVSRAKIARYVRYRQENRLPPPRPE